MNNRIDHDTILQCVSNSVASVVAIQMSRPAFISFCIQQGLRFKGNEVGAVAKNRYGAIVATYSSINSRAIINS